MQPLIRKAHAYMANCISHLVGERWREIHFFYVILLYFKSCGFFMRGARGGCWICITISSMFSYFVTWILGSLFRPESRWRVVCLVSFLLPERGRLLHAAAIVFLPRTKQKLLLPERASRGLWESQSLGGNKVCVLYIRTHFNSLLSYNVVEGCSLRWCNFMHYTSMLSAFLKNQMNLAQTMRKFQFGRLFLCCNRAAWQ